MKFELNKRTKILAGVVVLAGAAAAAWFLYLEEMLMGPEAAPVAAAPKTVVKPAAPGDGKPAAVSKEDEVIAGILEASGLKANLAKFGTDLAGSATSQGGSLTPEEEKSVIAAAQRVFEPRKLGAEISANLKKGYDAERMAKFLELLRDPVNVKMVSIETRSISPAELKLFMDEYAQKRPSPERARLVAKIDNVSRASELITDLSVAVAKATAERMLDEMEKSGAQLPQSARQQVSNEILLQKDKMRGEYFKLLQFTYKDVPDAELEQYVKLIDSDIGRFGALALHNALRPALETRGREVSKDLVQVAMAVQQRGGAAAKPVPVAAATPAGGPESAADAAKPPATAEQEKVAAAPVRAPEPPEYRRPDNLPELYNSKYNDIISAVVMRDSAATKELLADGKNPNTRQSDGHTALMVAITNGDMEIAQLLLTRGADPNSRGPQGVTALSLAQEGTKPELVKLLETHGAKP